MQPSQSRISIFIARVRTTSSVFFLKLSGFNAWIAAIFHTTRERIVHFELGGLLALGFTLMQIGEWALAIACWILLTCICLVKVRKWEGVNGQGGLTAFLRVLGFVAVIVGCLMLVAITDLRKPEDEFWSNLQKWNEPPCSVSVAIMSEIVARVHLRAMWLPSGGETGVYKPIFQDLFHDWVINVKPTLIASQVIISIQDARKPVDNIRVEPPENVTISEPTAGWFSGFDEPSQTPDFYMRTVSFATLDKLETITIRRAIKSHLGANTITSVDLDLDRQVHASAEKCKVKLAPLSTGLSRANPRFRKLAEELGALLAQKVSGTGFTTRLDPDEPYPPLAVNESEMIQELRCTSSPCTTFNLTMAVNPRLMIKAK